MILSNIKNNRKDRGFTIVELLVVIVVIGILAAITIVSYSGITARAKTSQAQSNANSVAQVAEAINADNGRFPGTTGEFSSLTSTAKLPSSITVSIADPTSANGQTTVRWYYVGGSAATATGGKITYFDFTTMAVSANVVYVGSATSGSTFVTPAS